MPWFKIDDSSHSHPKFVRAGNAALGLWVRCGAYSAQHLTEGHVPGDVARYYGTAPQIKKLVKVGLWHAGDHACDRCPQPEEAGDYVIHDFFEGGRNTTRAAHEANKQGAKERKAKSVARKKTPRIEDESKTNRNRIDDENDSNRDRKDPLYSGSDAGQDTSSHRTPSEGGATPHAMPCLTDTSYGGIKSKQEGAPRDDSAEIPEFARPLVDGLTANDVIVRWPFTGAEWLQLHAVVKRVGIPAMVGHARKVATRTSVESARYFTQGWKELPPIPAVDTERPALKAVSGGWQPFQNPANHDVYDEDLI